MPNPSWCVLSLYISFSCAYARNFLVVNRRARLVVNIASITAPVMGSFLIPRRMNGELCHGPLGIYSPVLPGHRMLTFSEFDSYYVASTDGKQNAPEPLPQPSRTSLHYMHNINLI
jgi:hypothetical protein